MTLDLRGQLPPVVFEQGCADLRDPNTRHWMTAHQKEGWGIFVTVQTMTGRRRRKEDIQHVRAVFHEGDRAEPPPAFSLPPSMVVETSTLANADGEVFSRLHTYWLTDPKHPTSPDDFHGIMECLVETFSSDPDAKDLARVLRLSGTWHLKGEPHRVRIIEASGARYSRDELLQAFPPPQRHEPDAKAQRPKFNGHTPPGLERFHEPLKAIPAVGYGIAIKVGQALHHESGGSAEG